MLLLFCSAKIFAIEVEQLLLLHVAENILCQKFEKIIKVDFVGFTASPATPAAQIRLVAKRCLNLVIHPVTLDYILDKVREMCAAPH